MLANKPVVTTTRRRKLYTTDEYIEGITILRIHSDTFLSRKDAMQLASELMLEAEKLPLVV